MTANPHPFHTLIWLFGQDKLFQCVLFLLQPMRENSLCFSLFNHVPFLRDVAERPQCVVC